MVVLNIKEPKAVDRVPLPFTLLFYSERNTKVDQ